MKNKLIIKNFGRQVYYPVWQQMKSFTHTRDTQTRDEIWVLEHDPVYTQGQAGKAEHILNPGEIPIVQSDRGGQVTYHGPGQLVIYTLLDLTRKKIGVRDLVCKLEQAVIELLANYNISAISKKAAPGVYVNNAKICSLGLRTRHNRSYHGLSLNIDMDLEPFSRINPCGFADLEMTQVKNLGIDNTLDNISKNLTDILINKLEYSEISYG